MRARTTRAARSTRDAPNTEYIAAVAQYCRGGFSKYFTPFSRGVTQSPTPSSLAGFRRSALHPAPSNGRTLSVANHASARRIQNAEPSRRHAPPTAETPFARPPRPRAHRNRRCPAPRSTQSSGGSRSRDRSSASSRDPCARPRWRALAPGCPGSPRRNTARDARQRSSWRWRALPAPEIPAAIRTMRRASSATDTQLPGLPMLKMRRVATPSVVLDDPQHAVDRIVDVGEGALLLAAVDELHRLPVHDVREELREHARAALLRLLDVVEVRADPVERPEQRVVAAPAADAVGLDHAVEQLLGAGVDPALLVDRAVDESSSSPRRAPRPAHMP